MDPSGSFGVVDARFFGNGGGVYRPAAVGDYDGDGDMDLASVGPQDVLIQLLDGDALEPVVATPPKVLNGGGGLVLIDF